ncbi:MAG: penicillin-binding protein 2 [Clostridium sp.]|nr:penicillin-binding protein 2 [Clostridium sp.]
MFRWKSFNRGPSAQDADGADYERRRLRTRECILYVTYGFTFLFIGMIAYFSWFLQFRSQEVIGSSYNARLDRFSDRIVRGKILSRDGQVLAVTEELSDGTEQRYYPFEYLFVHSVGYSAKNGKTGLESLGNFYLLSSHVNLAERVIHEFQGKKNMGDNLVSTLDAAMQQAADEAIGKRRGAVIAMRPDTGAILTMVSQPNFNANYVDERWEELNEDSESKAYFVNRATQGLYPPGSTFKILTMLEYIREHPTDWRNYTYHCDGSYTNGGYTISCYHGEANGDQNIVQAFANSCNGAFAQIGEGLDTAKFRSLAEACGFNSTLPLPVPGAVSSFRLMPEAGDWEKAQTAIGQGKTQMTAMLNLMIVSAIANGGTMMKPSLMDHVENAGGQTVKRFPPQSMGSIMSAEEAGILTAMMTEVVSSGTGSAFRGAPYTSAGKTGTAETGRTTESDAWYVGFAPAEKPEIAVCVILEEGGSGGGAAAPVARAVIDCYMERRGR